MKNMKIALLGLASALCVTTGVVVMNNTTYSASADSTVALSEVKFKISDDNSQMLLVAAIKNYDDVYEVGYEFVGYTVTANDTAEKTKYYESITTIDTETATDIFGNEWADAKLIVWEVANTEGASFYAYAKEGERKNGVLLKPDTEIIEKSNTRVNKKYTVTFVDEYGTMLGTQEVYSGIVPSFEDPVKAADAQYTYTFAGWDNEFAPVTEDITYTATYTRTTNKYMVTFLDENGNELQKEEVEYGATPVYNGTTPKKESDSQYNYIFSWDSEIVPVTGAAIYRATFKQEARVLFNDLMPGVYNGEARGKKETIVDSISDVDGDSVYWQITTAYTNGLETNLFLLSGTTDYREWCPAGLFGYNNYASYASKKIGLYVKVATDITFTLGGMAGTWATAADSENAQTVTVADGWKYIEFNLANLPSGYEYICGIKADVGGASVLVDGVRIFTNSYTDADAIFINSFTNSTNGSAPVKVAGKVSEDPTGDMIYWQMTTGYTNGLETNLFLLSGTTDYRDWCPAGLFGYNNYASYASKKMGMYVKVTTNITFTLGGMAGSWATAADSENAQTVTVADGWKYIEFNLANLPSGYEYICGIKANVSGASVLVDGVKVFSNSYSDTDAISFTNMDGVSANAPFKLVGMLAADANGDNEYWTISAGGANCIGTNLLVLTGNGEAWSPAGLFGQGVAAWAQYKDKYIGMWVKVSEEITFTLGGDDGMYTASGKAGSCTVTAADGWKYIEFKLGDLEDRYAFMSGILVDKASTIWVDGVEIYSAARL